MGIGNYVDAITALFYFMVVIQCVIGAGLIIYALYKIFKR